MVLQGHFRRRIVYGANSYQDNRGDYNSSLKVVGMKALVLFQAVNLRGCQVGERGCIS